MLAIFPARNYEKKPIEVGMSEALSSEHTTQPPGPEVQHTLYEPSVPTREFSKQEPCLNKGSLGKAHRSSQRFLSRQPVVTARPCSSNGEQGREKDIFVVTNKRKSNPLVRTHGTVPEKNALVPWLEETLQECLLPDRILCKAELFSRWPLHPHPPRV